MKKKTMPYNHSNIKFHHSHVFLVLSIKLLNVNLEKILKSEQFLTDKGIYWIVLLLGMELCVYIVSILRSMRNSLIKVVHVWGLTVPTTGIYKLYEVLKLIMVFEINTNNSIVSLGHYCEIKYDRNCCQKSSIF